MFIGAARPYILNEEQPNKGLDMAQFQIIENPNCDLRERLADLIDTNGHAPQSVDRDIISNAPYVLIITCHTGRIIAGSSIKSAHDGVAEFGFNIVEKEFRRIGLGYWMTSRRLKRADELGVSLVYSMIRNSNEASRNNLKKSGFRHAGRYLHRGDSKTRLDWYIRLIKPMNRIQRNHCMRRIIQNRVSVIH